MNYKISVVYTGMPVKLVNMVESALKEAFAGDDITILSLSDPSIIADAVKNGSPSREAARRLYLMYAQAVSSGADAILNACSSVGDIAAAAQPGLDLIGVPLVRIDELMALEAVRKYNKIGVIATLSSTLEPTKRLVRDCAARLGKNVEIIGSLADGAFGGGPEPLIAAAAELLSADCLILAQGSMADSKDCVASATGKETFASPVFGARGVFEAVKKA